MCFSVNVVNTWMGNIVFVSCQFVQSVETENYFRSLSRQDIQILVGFGCPTADKKVVFSSKLLRKHVHLDEGDVSVDSLFIPGTYYLYLHLV